MISPPVSSFTASGFSWFSVLKNRHIMAVMLSVLVMLCVDDQGVLTARLDAAEQNRSYQKSQKRAFDFDKKGIQAGQQVPGLKVVGLKGGKTFSLSDTWHKKPALIVTCSLTCPVARGRAKQVEKIAKWYGKDIQIVYLYTLEAHPRTDPSPYRGSEWITPKNEREKILYRQPTTMSERTKLAELFKKHVQSRQMIVLDNLKNEAWKALGSGPNVGILVDTTGKVVAKHGWFDGKSMANSIKAMLEKP